MQLNNLSYSQKNKIYDFAKRSGLDNMSLSDFYYYKKLLNDIENNLSDDMKNMFDDVSEYMLKCIVELKWNQLLMM